jgi:hypothetical protein
MSGLRLRLAGVLRTRQAREDAARGSAQRARAAAEAAAAQVRRWENALDLRGVPQHGTAASHMATLAARQALAAALCAAIGVSGMADEAAAEQAGEATSAAIERRTVERLAERHLAEQRRAEQAAEQRELDEIAAGIGRRPTPAGARGRAGR